MSNDKTAHWQSVYENKSSTEVSWFRSHLDVSLTLLKHAGLNANSRVIDIGAGASTLVDDLLDLGIQHITALDISAASLDVVKQRLGSRATQVEWIADDVTHHHFASDSIDLWHDRAALHFLIDPADTSAYVRNATRAICKDGYAIIAGFANDGPEKCSGLPVARREPEDIAKLFGKAFTLIEQRHETHATPWGSPQKFAYALLQKNA